MSAEDVVFRYDPSEDAWTAGLAGEVWTRGRGRTLEEAAANLADKKRHERPRDIAESALRGMADRTATSGG